MTPRPTSVQPSTARGGTGIRLSSLLFVSSMLFGAPWAQGAIVFWDTNGDTAGAGGSNPNGTWNDSTANNWSLDLDGEATTQAWDDGGGDTAVFSAGVDAVGAFTVTLEDTRSVDTITVEEGDVTITGGTALNLTGSATIELLAGNATIESVISGSAGLNKGGDPNAMLTLSGANTYTGTTTLGGGILRATTSANALGLGALDLTGDTVLELANDTGLGFNRNTSVSGFVEIQSDTLTPGTAGVTHTLGTLSIAGGDELRLTAGANVLIDTGFGLTFGATTVSGDTATFDVANNGTGRGVLTLGEMSGGGNFAKTGAGILALNTASTNSDSVAILNEGTLRLGNAAALGNPAVNDINLELNGGVLDLAIDSSVLAYDTTIDGSVTIASNKATPGTAGITHTLGNLDIGAGNVLSVVPGANVLVGTNYGLRFGDTTANDGGGASPSVFDVANNGSGIGTLTLGQLTNQADITKQGAGTLVLESASTQPNIDLNLNGGTVRLADPEALGVDPIGNGPNGVDLRIAAGTRVELGSNSPALAGNEYDAILSGTGTTATIVSDKATPSSVGITHNLRHLNIGASTLAVLAGSNVGSGTAGVEFKGTTTLTGGTSTFSVGSNARLTLGTVTGAGSAVTKSGAGALAIKGTSNFTGATTITGGTLEAAAVDALGSTSSVSVASGATLALTGIGDLDRVNDAAGIVLAGGSILKGFDASEGSEASAGLGTLTLSASSSTIDFGGVGGTGVGVLAFAGFVPAGFTLTIANWTGTPNALGSTGTDDRLIVVGDQSSNLSAYQFDGYGPGANQFETFSGSGLYEIVPVPEPGALLAGLLLLAPVAWRERRFFLRMRQVA